jgi:NAD(P)-dependent dehydrogenase (short-subunit alcohol dehydrogenase family)
MGQIAVVTGGAQGIGAAAAKAFLSGGFGGVVLVDRQEGALKRAAQRLASLGNVEIVAADVSEDATPAKVFSTARKVFGQVDVLLNAAGNTERCGLDDTTPEAFRRMFDVNVKAPLLMMQEAAKMMKPQGQGIIINIASMLAHGGPPNLATYSASKAALVTLSKSAANTYKRDGIRVFCVNLGWVNTDGEHVTQTKFHNMPENWAETIGKRMPFGRLITSDDVAGLIAFLVSPPAQMMTGAVIDFEQMPVGVFDTHPALMPE